MKKLLITSLVVIVLLTGCSQVVTPTQPQVEPTLPVEESPAVPTPIIEEPTEEPTPTLEPTVTPTEEPTPEPLPDRCPVEPYEVPEDLGEWTLDLGEYGIFGFTDSSNWKKSYIEVGGNGNILKRGEKQIYKFQIEGGSLSFVNPSPAIMQAGTSLEIQIDDEPWIFDKVYATSPRGSVIVPGGSKVTIVSEGQGESYIEYVLVIYFLSGNPVEIEDIDISSESTTSLCKDLFWEATITNLEKSDMKFSVDSRETFALIGSDEGILKASYLEEEEEIEMSIKAFSRFTFKEEKISILLAGETEVKFIFFSPFFREE